MQVLAVNAAIFAISTLFLSATPHTSAGTAVAPSGHVLTQLAADIGEGLRFVATHALVRPLVLTALAAPLLRKRLTLGQ